MTNPAPLKPKIYRRGIFAFFSPGYKVPWWLGRCWNDWEDGRIVTTVIPFNIPIRWTRDVWLFIRDANRWAFRKDKPHAIESDDE